MIYLRFGMLAIVIFIIWLIVKLSKSRKFDKFCNDLTSGKLEDEPTAQDTIKNISKEETNLGKTANKDIKEAEKLQTGAEGINDYLGNRGVKQAEKKEGS